MSYAKNGQPAICTFPGLDTRTAYDQQMQKVYCPIAQKAYRSPETLAFEPYSAPDQTNRLATPAATFSQLKNAYGLHITSPVVEGYCGCNSRQVNVMPEIIGPLSTDCPLKGQMKGVQVPGVL